MSMLYEEWWGGCLMGGYQQDVITICMQFPICINANESRRKRNERERGQDRKRKEEEEGVSGGMWRRRC